MANGRKPNLFDSRLSSRFFNPYTSNLNMDTSLLGYTPQDTLTYNRIDPSSLQIQSGDHGLYDFSILQTVYQSLPPVQGPQPSVETYSNMEGWGRNPFIPDEFVETEEEGLVPKAWMEPTDMPSYYEMQDMTDSEFETFMNSGENPIVAQATQTPISNVSTGNVQNEIPVSTGIGRSAGADVDVNQFISADVLDEMQNISSVPSGTMVASDPPPAPNPWRQVANQSQNMNLDTMDEAQRGIVDRAMRSGQPAQVPTGVMADVPIAEQSVQSPLSNIGASEVLGAGMQVGSSLMAMNQYGEAISDVEEGLGEIPGMLSETLTSAQRETDNIRDLLNTNVQSSADASNQKLQDSLSKLSSTNNRVGNIQNVSNNIRRTLQQGIDNTIAEASTRFDIQSSRIQESKRASVDAIESMKIELEAKKKELEKEKKQAGIGAAVGVGSLLADAFVPGSGQILRTGWNTYASNT